MDDKIDLRGLIPDFSQLGSFPETSSELSALFVSILIVVALFFVLLTILYLIKALFRVSRLKKLLKGKTQKNIFESRLSINAKAEKMKSRSGHLWMEFDETLIEVIDQEGNKKLWVFKKMSG